MYLNHYNLERKPFQITADPSFLWLGEKHKEALAFLKYGILDNKGFLLLTGDVGTGKTTLINALVESLGKDVIVATVYDPGLEPIEFYNFIAQAFKLPTTFKGKGEFLVYFRKFLYRAHDSQKKVLLIIDEAQRIDQTLLEEVRNLSNIEKEYTKLINIFFVGQNEFNNIILEHQNRAIRQRITLNYNLKPLDEDETAEYIKHRLSVSGTKAQFFSDNAIHEVFAFAQGYPRLINIICDHAMLSAYVKETLTITPDIIKECGNELRIERKKIPARKPVRKKERVKKAKLEPKAEAEPKGKIKRPRPPKKQRSTADMILYAALIVLLLAGVVIAGYLYYYTM
jgi:general secretion pathway protein A